MNMQLTSIGLQCNKGRHQASRQISRSRMAGLCSRQHCLARLLRYQDGCCPESAKRGLQNDAAWSTRSCPRDQRLVPLPRFRCQLIPDWQRYNHRWWLHAALEPRRSEIEKSNTRSRYLVSPKSPASVLIRAVLCQVHFTKASKT